MKTYILILFLVLQIYALDNFSDKTINDFKSKYNKNTTILSLWDGMLNKASKAKTLKKLQIVNNFFNKIKYATDIRHWKKKDYWASPTEFVGTRAGDCEDYAIAKYFSLLKTGIPSSKLRIAYVKLLHKRKNYEEAHMVLLYFHKLNSVPIVLDNVNKKLALASKRKDLKLIYSFNADGLWQAKNKGKTHVRKGSNKLSKWKNLMEKL